MTVGIIITKLTVVGTIKGYDCRLLSVKGQRTLSSKLGISNSRCTRLTTTETAENCPQTQTRLSLGQKTIYKGVN